MNFYKLIQKSDLKLTMFVVIFLALINATMELMVLLIVGSIAESSDGTNNSAIQKVMFEYPIIIFLILFATLVLRVVILRKLNLLIQEMRKKLADDVFQILIELPYSLALSRSRKDFLSKSINFVDQFVGGAIEPFVRLTTSVFSLTAVALFALVNFPRESMILLTILSTFYVVLFFVIRRALGESGGKVAEFTKFRSSTVMSYLENFKYLKVRDADDFYKNKFKHSTAVIAEHQAKQIFLSEVPKPVLETGIISVVAIVFILAFHSNQPDNLLRDTILLGLISLRALPMMQQIYSSISSLRYSRPVILELGETLEIKNRLPNSHFESVELPNKIETLTLNIGTLGYTNQPLIRNRSFHFEAGKLTVISGRSGTGKSSLLDVLIGLRDDLMDTSIFVNGHRLSKKSEFKALSARVAYVPQKISLIDGTVEDNICFGQFDLDHNKFERLLALVGLEHAGITAETIIGDGNRALSGGQEQRFALLRELYSDRKEIFVMDEPTSALDSENTMKLVAILQKLRRTKIVVIVTHDDINIFTPDKVERL